jgi:hypothetical protein
MKKEITNSESRDEKLVTVAIHTYEKAQILKSILESEGIPAVIHGINLIEPTIAGSVRVRINEKDLPNALRLIEQVDFKSTDEKESNYKCTFPRSLIKKNKKDKKEKRYPYKPPA